MPSLRCVSWNAVLRIGWVLTSTAGSGHQSPGLWRHPQDHSANFNDVEHWVNLAILLEKAKIHGIFIADVLGEHLLYTYSGDG